MTITHRSGSNDCTLCLITGFKRSLRLVSPCTISVHMYVSVLGNALAVVDSAHPRFPEFLQLAASRQCLRHRLLALWNGVVLHADARVTRMHGLCTFDALDSITGSGTRDGFYSYERIAPPIEQRVVSGATAHKRA